MGDCKVENLISEASLLSNPQDYLCECTKDYTSVFGNASLDVSVPAFQWEENQNTPFAWNNKQIEDIYENSSALNFEC